MEEQEAGPQSSVRDVDKSKWMTDVIGATCLSVIVLLDRLQGAGTSLRSQPRKYETVKQQNMNLE